MVWVPLWFRPGFPSPLLNAVQLGLFPSPRKTENITEIIKGGRGALPWNTRPDPVQRGVEEWVDRTSLL